MTDTNERLEELRAAIRAENISYGELAELQGLGEAGWIDPNDMELREWAGLEEFPTHLTLTRDGTACGSVGDATAEHLEVTCPVCVRLHDEATSEPCE